MGASYGDASLAAVGTGLVDRGAGARHQDQDPAQRRARSDPPKRTGEPLHDRTGRVIAEGDIVRSDEGWVWEVFRLFDYAVDPDRSLRPVVGLRPHGAPAPGKSAHTQRPPDTLEVITPAASSTGAAG